MTTMRAAVYERYGAPEVVAIRDVPMPSPKANELLVRIHATTVSSGDWRMRSLEMPKGFGPFGRLAAGILKPRQPILGTEFSGQVVQVGASVTRFKVGDEVFVFVGAAMGSHAEYRCVTETDYVALKPANMTHEEAAALGFGGMTVLRYLRAAKLARGERLLINGASGAIGVAAIQLAKHFGAHVTAVCSGPNVALAASLGADEAIDYTLHDFTRNGVRYDVVLDAAGTAPYERAAKSLTERGRFVPVLGSLGDLLRAPWVSTTSKRRIVGGVVRSAPGDLKFLAELARAGEYRAVIDRRYAFDDIVEAHRYVDTGRKRGSVVVTL